MSFALTFDYGLWASSREAIVTASKEPKPFRPRVGDRLASKYVLQRMLGEGGMGMVFAATDETLGRDVAVKLLHARGLSADRLFKGMQREARALAALDHPNVVRVIEAGVEGGQPFLVMELVEGKTLRLLSEHLGPIEVISSIAFAVQVARALAAAHARGLVHCDLKPDNILVSREGRIKVTDFGLARHVERGRLGTTDQLVEGCGTPHYMAPELFLGKAPSAASDVYALGATLIELLTGKYMFSRDSVDIPGRVEVRQMHLAVEPEPIEDTCGPLVAPLGDLIRAMVAKDPRERPTAEEVVAGLRYEHLRLRKHFPAEGEARRGRGPDDDDDDDDDDDEEASPPARRPSRRPGARDVERALAASPEEARMSARVFAFVTEELPAAFVPRGALPRGFEGRGRLERAETVPAGDAGARRNVTEPMPVRGLLGRQKVTEPMPVRGAEEAVRARQQVTEPMPAELRGPAPRNVTAPMPAEGPVREVRVRELPAREAERAVPGLSREVVRALRMEGAGPTPRDGTRSVPGPGPERSGDAVTVPADRRAARPVDADDAPQAPGMVRMRPVTLAAIGFAVLSVGLLSRDLIQQLRRTEAAVVTAAPPVSASAAPVVTAKASATASATASGSASSSEPASAPPAAGTPASATSPSSVPASATPASSVPAPTMPSVAQRPPQRAAAPGSTGKTTSPASPSVVDPWARPSKPTTRPSSSAPPPSASPPKPGTTPLFTLPYGKGGE